MVIAVLGFGKWWNVLYFMEFLLACESSNIDWSILSIAWCNFAGWESEFGVEDPRSLLVAVWERSRSTWTASIGILGQRIGLWEVIYWCYSPSLYFSERWVEEWNTEEMIGWSKWWIGSNRLGPCIEQIRHYMIQI